MSTLFKDQSKKLEFTTQSLSFAEHGYSILPALSEKELSSLRHIIRDKYIKNLKKFRVFDFENDETKQPFNYHNLCIKNHSEIWESNKEYFLKRK